MPQLPQMPIRHDQRNERVVSISFLTWLSPSRTVHSFRRGPSYSCQWGSESVSGRYRDTLSPMLSAMVVSRRRLSPVDPLAGRPAGESHREALDPRRPVGIAAHHQVGQEALVVAGREVGALVRP